MLLNDVHAFDDDMAVVNAGEDGALRALVTASNDDDFVALTDTLHRFSLIKELRERATRSS